MGNPKKTATLDFQKKCNSEEGMAIREFISRIGDKWSIILIIILSESPNQRARFSDLKRNAHGISQAMLTSTLRDLERDGLISREVFPEVPPRVEYELTSLGRGLLEPISGLAKWVTSNWTAIKKARAKVQK